MDSFLRTLSDQTINGLVIGNIYALTAVGLALIFGVGNLINFAHGSVYMIGAYVGWVCVTRLHLPLPVTFIVVAVACALLGMLIERFGLRRLQNSAAHRAAVGNHRDQLCARPIGADRLFAQPTVVP